MIEYYWARVAESILIIEFVVIFVWAARHDGDESTIVPNYMRRFWKVLCILPGALACGFGRHCFVDTGLIIHGAHLLQCDKCGLQVKDEKLLWPTLVSEQEIAEAQERITDSESRIERVPNTAWTTSVTQVPGWAAPNMDSLWLNTLAQATEEGTQEQTDPAPQQVTNLGMRVIRFKKHLQAIAKERV